MTYPDQSDASNVTISDVINNNGQVREGFKNKKKSREFSLTGGTTQTRPLDVEKNHK